MEQILLMLLEHPLTLGFCILCFMGLVAMTYEFILRLFGKRGMKEPLCGVLEDNSTEDPPV